MAESAADELPVDPGAGMSMPARYRPSYERVAEELLEFIVSRRLQPGDRLPTELELAGILECGRGVVREAVKILSALGRVRIRKGSGLYVADDPSPLGKQVASSFIPADLEHLTMLFEFRMTVDGQAARWAALRATPAQLRQIERAATDCRSGAGDGDRERFCAGDSAFHDAVVAAAGNMFLASAHGAVRDLQAQSAVLGLEGQLGGSMREAAESHMTIFEHIRGGRSDAAARAAEVHVERTWSGYQDEIRRRIFGDGHVTMNTGGGAHADH